MSVDGDPTVDRSFRSNVQAFLFDELAKSYYQLSKTPEDQKLQGRIEALLDILDRLQSGEFDP